MVQTSCDDAELVVRTCRGDNDAFAELVARYQDYMHNTIGHMVGFGQDAEDLTQEVFLKAYRGLGGFRRRAQFSTWLYGIMLNCVRSYWRHKGRRPNVVSLDRSAGEDGDDPAPDPPSPTDGPDGEVERSENVAMIRAAIGRLPEELREIVVMRDLQGMSYEDLALTLDLPLGTVKSRLARARSALKDAVAPLLGGGL